MADVKWIKIVTDIFDDEKILMIETLPSSDTIIVIWFKLLCFAGKMNNDGVLLMNNRIAYTDEMLAAIFRRDVNTVRMAMQVFEKYGMIEVINNVITIPNWNKHQTLDAYEKKKERDKLYQQERRKKQRQLVEKSSDISSDCKTIESSDVAVSEEDKEEDKEKDINNIIISASGEPDPPVKKKSKPVKHKYGEYKNVLLTDDELSKLKAEYSDWEERIENLSSYVASTGKTYKSHYATIRNWARKEAKKEPVRKEVVPAWMKKKDMNNFERRQYDMEALEGSLLNSQPKASEDP